jgi:hypothetical protein
MNACTSTAMTATRIAVRIPADPSASMRRDAVAGSSETRRNDTPARTTLDSRS